MLIKFTIYLALLSPVLSIFLKLPFTLLDIYFTFFLVWLTFSEPSFLEQSLKKLKLLFYLVILNFMIVCFYFDDITILNSFLINFRFFYLIPLLYLKKKVINFDIAEITTKIVIFLSFAQVILLPNLISISHTLNIDPHTGRIFGSFLDPNYWGVLGLLLFVCIFNKRQLKFLKLSLVLIILLTFSKSTLLVGYIFIALNYPLTILLLPIFSYSSDVFSISDSVFSRFLSLYDNLSLVRLAPLFGLGFGSLTFFKRYNYQENDIARSSNFMDTSLLQLFYSFGVILLIVLLLRLYRAFPKLNSVNFNLLFIFTLGSFFNNIIFFLPLITIFILLLEPFKNAKIQR